MKNRLFNRREILKISAFAGATAFFNPGTANDKFSVAAAQIVIFKNSLIKLYGNENPYGPSPKAKPVIIEAAEDANRYAQTETAALEKIIAEREGVSPESVVLATGLGEVLAVAGVAYGIDKGDIVTADPTFGWLMLYAEKVRALINRVPLNFETAHDLDEMKKRVSTRTRLIYVCNPNNPTGTVVDADKIRRFCAEVSKTALVLVDEAYLEYLEDFPDSLMIDLVRRGANVIVLRTFSKIYGLAGMRVEYGLAKPEIAAVLRKFRITWLNPVSLRAAIASLKDEEFVRECRLRNAKTREFMRGEFEKLKLAQMPSRANAI